MWPLFIWNCQARPMEEVLSCQSQDNLSVQKQILKSVHFHVGAPAPSSPPYATKTQIWKCPPIQHCEWVCTIHVKSSHTILEEGSIRPHVFTPQLLSPDSLPCQPPEEQDIFFSLTLIGVFVWKESTYQAWRRLRSRWSSTIIHRVLKLQNIVNSELLASIKLCKLTVCLSIFLNCGTPLKIAKFISYIFFEKPCTVFNI